MASRGTLRGVSESPESTEERPHPAVPPLPSAILDPRPILALGTIAWLLAAIALFVFGGKDRQIALCIAGIVVGVIGTTVYAMQRRAVERGARGAQQGLDFDA